MLTPIELMERTDKKLTGWRRHDSGSFAAVGD
jgi:hypothetical protein